jgi:mannose-6-phosphate isomerase-like protein (cupin superfamily)
MANGSITYVERDDQAGKFQWNVHPKFKGVYLKHLIRGTDTEGQLSCHLVRLDPESVLEHHIHEDQWELHEVIEGEGSFVLGTKMTPYYPGRMGIIPKGTSHKVVAGKVGLVLLAKFFPALL